MKDIDINSEYVFCDQDLTSYEKTIYTLAMAYGSTYHSCPSEAEIDSLSNLLSVESSLLKRALTIKYKFCMDCIYIRFGSEILDCSGFFKSTFFFALRRLFYAYKDLENISDTTSEKDIINNITMVRNVIDALDSANSSIAVYECILDNRFSLDYTLFDSGNFSPSNYLNTLELLVSCDDCIEYDKTLLSILSLLSQYELKTRLNALYVILTTEIIKHSPFFDNELHEIAKEMYDNLMFILKNGRIISIQINSLHMDFKKSYAQKTKNDNTTRMQILYGYPNYDAYSLRIDFSHQGQPFVHFNNESPGKVSSCLFDKSQYESAIKQYPFMNDCFIQYGNRWALKEKHNCNLSKQQNKIFTLLEKQKSHDLVFKNTYSEESICGFIELISNMLPKKCKIPIDKTNNYTSNCFCYDKIMRNIASLSLFQQPEIVDKIFREIIERAYRLGLISANESISSLEDLCYIIYSAKDKAKPTP